jgi:hypothetical protein
VRDVGDEAQPALVDAHQRQVVAGQFAGYADHGAVAAHHHRQVAALAQLLHRHAVEIGHAGGLRGLAFEAHLEPQADQEVRQLLEHRPNAAGLVLAHDGGMTEALRHARH